MKQPLAGQKPSEMTRDQLVYEVERLNEYLHLQEKQLDKLRERLARVDFPGAAPVPNTREWWRWHFAGQIAPVVFAPLIAQIPHLKATDVEVREAVAGLLQAASVIAGRMVDDLQKGGAT